MTTQEEIIQLRDELTKIQVKARKSRTRGIVGMALLVLVSICSVTYGYLQQVIVEKSIIEAMWQGELAKASAMEAQRNMHEAKRQQELAMAQEAAAAAVVEDLRKCCAKKK